LKDISTVENPNKKTCREFVLSVDWKLTVEFWGSKGFWRSSGYQELCMVHRWRTKN